MTDNRVLLFFRNLSTIGLPVVTLFSATAQLFVYFLNQYWLKILGITYQLNVVESLYVSFGMILITTVGLIIFYGLILVLSFSLLRDGIELAKKFPLITKLNLFIYAFINKSDLTRKVSDSTKTWFPAVFVVLPFFLMILWGTSKFKFFVWPLITATSFLCFLLVMIALRNWLSAFIDWGRKVPNFTEDAASESKLMSYIKSIVFISIGFLVPSVIIFLHMWVSYWIYASFIGVVMSAHVASFIYINQKNLIGVVISIVLFILLAFAYWFDIGKRSAEESKKFIFNNESQQSRHLISDGLIIFPKIHSGNIYIENYKFVGCISGIDKLKAKAVNPDFLKDVKFIESKDSDYVLLPMDDNKSLGLLEIKNGKIIKFVSP